VKTVFTGLVSDIGEVMAVRQAPAGARLSITCSHPVGSIATGASIACAGVCLTVTGTDSDPEGRTVFSVDVSEETLRRTTLGGWRAGTKVNLERSLKAGDELGGHLVTGHVDGTVEIAGRDEAGGAARFDFVAPGDLAGFIAEKGSVALDGTSLTVNGVDGRRFWITLIPHTLAVTTWSARRPGEHVNLEVDILARYVARFAQMERL
jgi:riboflavin synthase